MNNKTKKVNLSFVIFIFLTTIFLLDFSSCKTTQKESSNNYVEGASNSVTSVYNEDSKDKKKSSKNESSSEKSNSAANENKSNDLKNGSANSRDLQSDDSTKIDLSSATKINIEKKSSQNAKSNYFNSINNEIISAMKNGSPSSIRSAVTKLKKADIDYAENELVLLNIASSIMSLVWKSEIPLENIPEKNPNKKYADIIESAQKGIFESRSGDKDFFQLVLPCLALVSSSSRIDYLGEAESNLLSALSQSKNSVLCNYLLAILYKKRGNADQAILYLDKATEKNSIIYEIYFEKASCLVQVGRYDQVSKILEPLLIQYPSDTKILKLYANACLLLKDYQKAERYASLVLQQNPSDLEFVLFRAKIFVQTGEYLKASSLLDVYARTYPTNKEYLLLRAIIQKEWNRNLVLSVSTIERALELYPNDFDIVLYAARLAVISNKKINGKTGGELANEILKISANNLDALKVLSLYYYNSGLFLDAYSISKKLMTNSASLILQEDIFMHIKICLSLNYNDEAYKYSSSLYEKNPTEIQAAQTYIDVLIRTRRTGAASKLINSLLNNSPTSLMKSFLFYERSFLQASEAAVLSDLRSSLIANPRNSDALFKMYEVYFKRKDYKKAQYYLKQVVSLNPNNEKYLKLNSALDGLIQ